eukprot:TRINITY_DN27059_c0_g1_i1.p1 TRINITY_DN27059_c0_g1~~TRINITY_DN27059_c0_g1_i1.p1  ORF type:complete len:238 (-),score=47.64 TRINITY_DN27059_c0_g1_i1:261-974(-)
MLIPLTFLALVEAVVALLLISRIPPLYKLGRACVDLLSTAKGVAISRTLFVTFLVLLVSSLSSIQRTKRRIRNAGVGGGHLADQHLLRTQFLETAMLGYCLLLAVAVNRFHAFLGEKANLKLQLVALKKQAKGTETEYKRLQDERIEQKRLGNLDEEVKSCRDVIADLRRKLEELQIESQAKDKEIKAADANCKAVQKQAEGSQLEYLRLLEETEHLRSQLSSHDRDYYTSDAKKDS